MSCRQQLLALFEIVTVKRANFVKTALTLSDCRQAVEPRPVRGLVPIVIVALCCATKLNAVLNLLACLLLRLVSSKRCLHVEPSSVNTGEVARVGKHRHIVLSV